jgi:hypothetical protein
MRVNQNLHRALNINLDEEIAQTKSTSGHQPTSNLYYYIKAVRGSLPPPDSAFSQSTPSIYIHQIITVRLVASSSSLLHPSIVTAPLSAPLFLDISSIKLHPRHRRQWLRSSHAAIQPPPDSPPHTAAAPTAHPPCSPPWPPRGGFSLPESPPNQIEKSTWRSFCTSRTGAGRGARQRSALVGRVSPGPMASAKSSRSRPTGHFGVFPVNVVASDGGVQLVDKLKIFKTDNFDPDAYVQSKCRAMDEKVRNLSGSGFRLQC